MITDNDKQIAKYIETVGMCTASQIAKIFYKNESQGNNIARRRLRKLEECGYIKIERLKEMGATNIYKFNSNEFKNFVPSFHYNLLLDYYAELFYCGAKVKYFKKGQEWLDRKVKNDAFIIFDFEGTEYMQMIEVAVTNFSPSTIKKYEDLYDSNEVQDIFKRFPDIVLIEDGSHFNKVDSKLNFIKLNHNLDSFPKIFLRNNCNNDI